MILGEQQLVIESLAKGLNTYDGDTNVPEGFYVDAQNMVLTNKNPVTIGGLTKLNTTAANGNLPIIWFEPYANPTVSNKIIVAQGDGSLWNYDRDTDTWSRLYQGLEPGHDILWSSVPFRGDLILANGHDPIIKYDGEAISFIGTTNIADFESDETWTGGTIITDSNFVVEGQQSISIAAGETAETTFPETLDLFSGIGGGPDFDPELDTISFRIYKPPGSTDGSFTATFITSVGNTFAATVNLTSADDGFIIQEVIIEDFTETGSPDWASITGMSLSMASSNQAWVFDHIYIGYGSFEVSTLAGRPPIGKYVEMYQQQLFVGGLVAEGEAMQVRYSDPGTIDYFPVDNFAIFSGGRHQMEKPDQVTALRTYFDELIVGKVNSAWTLHGTGTDVAIQALPLTIGIDSHRGVIETPWALHFPFENNIFGARLTSRGIVSQNVNPLLSDLDGNELDRIMALRHDRTHTVRWTFRTNEGDLDAFDCPKNDLGLIYDHQLDAWCCRYTPEVRWYSRAIVEGVREILVGQYDAYIRRADTGTDFDGTPIESYVTLPWKQSPTQDRKDKVTRWLNVTLYLRGDATVSVQARFADEPHEFSAATWTTFGTIGATPDGDKGFAYFGRTGRWMQLKLSASAGAFEVLMPISIGFVDTGRRV